MQTTMNPFPDTPDIQLIEKILLTGFVSGVLVLVFTGSVERTLAAFLLGSFLRTGIAFINMLRS